MKKNVKGSVVKATSLGLAAVMASTPITAFAEEAPAEVPVAENPAPEAEVIVAAPAVSEQAAEVAEDVKETAENVENIVPNAVPYLTNPAPNGEGEVVEEDPIDKPILVKPEQIEIHLVGEVKKVTDSEQDPVEYVPGLAEEVEKVAELDEDAEDKAASAENSEEVAAGAANDADKAADAAAASLSQADINAANELIKTAKDALTTAENERTAAEEAVTAAQTALNELLVANGLDPEDETLDVTKLDGNAKKAYDEAMAVLNSAKADRDQKVKFENICKAAYGKKLAEVNRAFGDVAQKQAVYDTVSGVADTLDEAYEDALEEANQANLELKVAQHKAYWDKLAEDKKLADAQKKEREAVIAASRAYENYQKAMAAEKTAQAVYDKTALLKAQEELEAAMKAAGFKNEWQIPSVKDAEEALERANDAVTAAEEAERKAWGDLWNAMRAAGIKRIDKVMDPTQAAAAKKAAEDKLTELQGKKTIADGEKNSALQDLKDAKDAVTDLSDQISEIGLEGLKTDSDAADAEVTRLNNEIATERAKLVDDKEAVTNVTNLEAKEAQYTVGQEKQSVADAASAVNQLRNDVTALENAASNAEREASDKRNKAQEYREIAQDLNHDGGWFDGWDGYGYDPAKAQLYLDEANRLETEANAKSAEAATNRQTVDTKKQEATAKEEGIRNALLAAAKDAGVKVDRTPVVIGDTKYTYGEYKLVKTRYGYALQCYITVSVYNSWTHQYDDNVPWARDIGEKIIFTQGQYNEQNSKLQSQLTSARETLSGIQSANEGVNTTISGLQGQLVTALTTQTEKNAAYQTAYDLINGTDGLNSQLEAARGQQESAQTAYDRKKDAADAIDTAIGKINRNIKRNGKQWAAGIALGALQSAQATLKNARLDAAIAGA
nr:hypothetical protein [Pseudobutyrivibrio sp.]